MLRLEGVRKVFVSPRDAGHGYLALDGVDLEVADGEFVCLLGASGCGKTTLLHVIAGFEQPTSGTVMLDGRPITGPGRDRMMVFQDAGEALLPWLTAEENVHFALRLKGVPRGQRPAVADRYLELVGLGAHRRKFPAELSGGMRQRLQIARALALDPRLLLMDEPFAALDALTRRHMHRELLDIWERTRKTIVFVTHDISEAVLLADHVAIMSVGPGSVIRRWMAVEWPRPRDLDHPLFGRYYAQIEEHLRAEMEAGR
jgi:NitT/TauT family transport system ATP-binding protein